MEQVRNESWEEAALDLAERVEAAVSTARAVARAAGTEAELARPAADGVGDVTFGLDVPSERAVDAWLEETAARGPLSLLTEEAGWRHRGPSGDLPGFDHGGPRFVIDPIDGTRNLMADLRSAWTVIALAPPGEAPPRQTDATAAVVSELPDSRAAVRRLLTARRGGGTTIEELDVETGARRSSHRLTADADDRVDNGYFPVFRYRPEQRPAIAQLEEALFRHLTEREGCDARTVYDDQYICNAGQLILLAQGTYRAVFDPRAWVGARRSAPSVTTKPYDVAGAILCAREAGAVVTAIDGGEPDFPWDATTPVSFAGYANEATRKRVEPCWHAALAEFEAGG